MASGSTNTASKSYEFAELLNVSAGADGSASDRTSPEFRERENDRLRNRFVRALAAEHGVLGSPRIIHRTESKAGDPIPAHSDGSKKRATFASFPKGVLISLYEATDLERLYFELSGPRQDGKRTEVYSRERLDQLVQKQIEVAGTSVERMNAFTKRIYTLGPIALAKECRRLRLESAEECQSAKLLLTAESLQEVEEEKQLKRNMRTIVERRLSERYRKILAGCIAQRRKVVDKLIGNIQNAWIKEKAGRTLFRVGAGVSSLMISQWKPSRIEDFFEQYISQQANGDPAAFRADLLCQILLG